MITDKDKDAIAGVVDAFEGAFISGSYLVDKTKANDIDVVVPFLAWKLFCERNDGSHGLWLKGELRGSFEATGVLFEAQKSESDDDNYADDENEMHELHSHWRGGGINLLIVRDMFIPAYRAASYRLQANPKAYDTRDKRVEVHQRMKQVIRDMLESATMDGDEIPW